MLRLRFWAAILVLAVAVLALARPEQEYRAKPGETVMKIAVEGRGNIYVTLFTKEAPRTTGRIIELVRSGFYNGQKVHRLVRSPRPYLVQMGAPSSRSKNLDDPSLLEEGTGVKLAYEESGVSNSAEGIVGLSALPGDRNTGDCQFHILLNPAKFLDGNYTVFGRVAAGIEVVRKLEKGDRIVSITLN